MTGWTPRDEPRSATVSDPERRTPATRSTRQPSGGRRRFSISSTSRPRGLVWPVWPVHRKTAKRVMAWPTKAAAIPPVTTVSQPPMQADPHRQDQQVAVPAGRPEPRRERVDDRLR